MARGPAAAPALTGDDQTLRDVIEHGPRSAADKARDAWRHPYGSLIFWGLKPGMTVIDVAPGTGWWTEILAPYLARTGGHYIAALADLDDPKPAKAPARAARRSRPSTGATEALRQGQDGGLRRAFRRAGAARHGRPGAGVARDPRLGEVDGFTAKAFGDFHAALKQGGVLAVEDHRAPDGADPKKGDGYISEAWVIDAAREAGFRLAARSDINANPQDTKDYPFGVWTLPPTRRSAPAGQPPNPAFDHAKYDAIGESDRMTLKFVKA